MKFQLRNTLLVVLLLTGQSTFATNSIQIGQVGYAGTGCPAGTASVIIGHTSGQLSLRFDQYKVEAGGNTGRQEERKFCGLSIPIHVPQGLSIGLQKARYQGSGSLALGTNGNFRAEYFFAGSSGPILENEFNVGLQGAFEIEQNLSTESMVWSRCGEDVNLRVNTSLMVKSSETHGGYAYLQLDGSGEGKPILEMQVKNCSMN